MKRRKTLGSDEVNHSNKSCHPAHDNEQQQRTAAADIAVRRAAAHSITIIIDHVQVLCYETAYGICETSREEEK